MTRKMLSFLGTVILCAAVAKSEPGNQQKSQYQVMADINTAIKKSQSSEVHQYFNFQKSLHEVYRSNGPHIPFKINVILKKEFSGTATFYSCDTNEFRFIDSDSGEFIKTLAYEVNAKSGQIASFEAEYYNASHPQIGFAAPPICGEVIANNKLISDKEHLRQITRDVYTKDADEWSADDLLQSLHPYNEIWPRYPFAISHAKRLLKVFQKEKAYPVLFELVSWLDSGDKEKSTPELIQIIISRFGGKAAAPELAKLLKNTNSACRKAAIELLAACGNDAKQATPEINELLASETDISVISALVPLAKRLKIRIPLNHLPPEDIALSEIATHKKEIKDACDFAATVDVSENDIFHESYDENGKRIPLPQNAQKAISSLEDLISRLPNYPEMAQCSFILGKL